MALGGILTSTLTAQVFDGEDLGAVALGTLARYNYCILATSQASITEFLATSSANGLIVAWALAFLARSDDFIVAFGIALVGEFLTRFGTNFATGIFGTVSALMFALLLGTTTRTTTGTTTTTTTTLFNDLLEAVLVVGDFFTAALCLTAVREVFTGFSAYGFVFGRAVASLSVLGAFLDDLAQTFATLDNFFVAALSLTLVRELFARLGAYWFVYQWAVAQLFVFLSGCKVQSVLRNFFSSGNHDVGLNGQYCSLGFFLTASPCYQRIDQSRQFA
jgi:hypothetical protein